MTEPASPDGGDASPPPRSRLYALAPIGLRTPEVERVTTYIGRLATEHCLAVDSLVRHELAPLLKDGSHARRPSSGLMWKEAYTLNGTGAQAEATVRKLQDLTGRRDLIATTLRPWAGAIPARDLLRPTRAWCPSCYRERLDRGLQPYDPLLWSLNAVAVCPRHRTPLRERCPHPACRRTIPVLGFYAHPGHCAHCGGSLAIDLVDGMARGARGDLDDQVWAARCVGELLAAPDLDHPPTREDMARAIAGVAHTLGYGSSVALTQALGVSYQTVRYWRAGTRQPSLGALLRLCTAVGTTPLALLTGKARPEGIVSRTPRPQRPGHNRRFETEGVRAALEGVLAAEEDPPPAMALVARRLGYYHTDLQPRFPDLCRAISGRYLAHRRQQGERRRDERCDAIRQATIAVHAHGLYPSEERVMAATQPRVDFRSPGVHEAWRAALSCLGVAPAIDSLAGVIRPDRDDNKAMNEGRRSAIE